MILQFAQNPYVILSHIIRFVMQEILLAFALNKLNLTRDQLKHALTPELVDNAQLNFGELFFMLS